MKLPDNAVTILVGSAVALGGYVLLKREAGQAVKAAGKAVNPTDPDNLVNRAVNGLGRALADDQHWTLGGWLYDITHDDPLAQPERGQVNQAEVKARIGTNQGDDSGQVPVYTPPAAVTWWYQPESSKTSGNQVFPSGGA